MSTNCLVTKLKASVDNDTLLYFGALKFRMPAGVEKVILRTISWEDDNPDTIAPNGTKVKILSNGYFKHPSDPTPVYYDEHVVTNESIAIFPTDNTKPVDFIIYGYDSYSPTGKFAKTSLICYNPIDSLIGYTNLKYLNLSVFDDVVDFNDFSEKALTLANIVSFIGSKINYKNTTLSDLGTLINATVINISDSNLGGSIESLVEVFRNLGRTAPVTDLNFYGSNITYEGSPIGSMGGHYTLSWTENTISLTKNN